MERILLTVFVCVAGATLALGAGGTFSYDEADPNGPSKWGGDCNKENKTRQSPIDIHTADATYEAIPAFTFDNYDYTEQVNLTIFNTGDTLKVNLPSNVVYTVSGGGLGGTFHSLQFHFHWGSVNSKGSEHTMDGKSYPAEVHIVSMNNQYADLSQALPHSDGLAVLGFFLEIGEENTALKKIFDHASHITMPKTNITVNVSFPLDDMIPSNLTKFYRYPGSLTTPDCNQAVIWTVFNNTIHISQAQLDQMRSLNMSATEPIGKNYRPVQDLHGRTVKVSFEEGDMSTSSTSSTASPESPTSNGSHLEFTFGLLSMLFAAIFMN